jgi:hypothetical protein
MRNRAKQPASDDGVRRGRGRPRKDDPATPDSIRFTREQRRVIREWQTKNAIPTFSGAVHALLARALGE